MITRDNLLRTITINLADKNWNNKVIMEAIVSKIYFDILKRGEPTFSKDLITALSDNLSKTLRKQLASYSLGMISKMFSSDILNSKLCIQLFCDNFLGPIITNNLIP